MSYIYGPKEIEKMVFIKENKINNYIYINGDSIEGSELFKNDVCILNLLVLKIQEEVILMDKLEVKKNFYV